MCELIDKYEKRGEKKGIRIGKRLGREQGRTEGREQGSAREIVSIGEELNMRKLMKKQVETA